MVAATRLNIPYNKIGRLTYSQFDALYTSYKKMFDLEMMMQRSGTTYEKLAEESMNEGWF